MKTKWIIRRLPFSWTWTGSVMPPLMWRAWRIDERGWEITYWADTWSQAMHHADINPPSGGAA